jgi:hypothetical protein
MKQGLKPSSAVLVRPIDAKQPIECCICSFEFNPVNYEDKTMQICPQCALDINNNIGDYANNSEDELDVSYFIM